MAKATNSIILGNALSHSGNIENEKENLRGKQY